VSGIPGGSAASITDTSGDSTSTTTGNYSMCVSTSSGTQSFTARAGTSCATYSGTAGPISVTAGQSYTVNISVSAQPYATVNGTVTGIPSGQTATITAATGEEISGVTGSFTLCVTAGGSTTTQSLAAQVGPTSCGGSSGNSGSFAVSPGQTYTENITVTPEPACPQPTNGTGPAVTCPPNTVTNEYSDYITVTVRYPVGIFVPFVGAIFQTQPGLRMITTSVTYAVEPCTVTQGR
jgi:hypothetical protein